MKHEALYRIYLAYYSAKLAGGLSLSMQLPSVSTTSDHAALALAMHHATEPVDIPFDAVTFADAIDNLLAPPEAE